MSSRSGLAAGGSTRPPSSSAPSGAAQPDELAAHSAAPAPHRCALGTVDLARAANRSGSKSTDRRTPFCLARSGADELPDDGGDHGGVGLVGEVAVPVEHADLGVGDGGRRPIGRLGHDRDAVGAGQEERRGGDRRRTGRAGTPSPPRLGTPGGRCGRRRGGPATAGWTRSASISSSVISRMSTSTATMAASVVALRPAPPRWPRSSPAGR